MNFRLKLIAYTFLVVLIVGNLIAFFSIRQGREQTLETYEKECRKITELISRTVANHVYFLDVNAIRQQLAETRINPEIKYIYVTDLEGAVLSDDTAENRLREKKLIDPFSREILQSKTWITQVDQKNLIKIGGPIRMPDGSAIGYLQMGYSLEKAHQIIDHMTRVGIFISITCLGVGAVLAFFVSGNFTRPIRKLVRLTDEIRRGNFEARVSLNREDELGILGNALNNMVENLRKRTHDLSEANRELEKEILERKRAEEKILNSLQEKEVLLKEIHHRVKNNLQIIISLLHLQTRKMDDPRLVEVLKESENRVKSISLIHEQLYLFQDLAKIDFGQYLRNISHQLFRSYGVDPASIALKIETDRLFLSLEHAVPCSVIVNELVTNSLKHAFPAGRKGEICIVFREAGTSIELLVSDNGVGLPAGWEIGKTSSLGLQLVVTLTEQLKGTLEYASKGGAAFKIAFPKS